MGKINEATRAIEFIERLKLVDDYYGEPCKLRPWQKKIIRGIFAKDTKKAFLLLPRKHAKTWLCAALSIVFLFTKSHWQIVCAASAEHQIKTLYRYVKTIIEQDEYLLKNVTILPSKGKITCKLTGSELICVGSGGKSIHSLSPNLVILDELHAWTTKKHQETYEALTTGSGARKERFVISISTQTTDQNSICADEFKYACDVQKGIIENKYYKTFLHYADVEDDWTDEKVWKKACPALGDWIDFAYYREEFEFAKKIPSRERSFKTYFLNMPFSNNQAWCNLPLYQSTLVDRIEFPDDIPVVLGADVAPVHDLSAVVACAKVDGIYRFKSWLWCSDQSIFERSKFEGVPYDIWAERGFIKATCGNSTNFDVIKDDIIEISKQLNVVQLAADKAHFFQLGSQLESEGIPVAWYTQSFLRMSPPMRRFEKLLLDQSLQIENNPVLTYCMSNVIAEENSYGDIRPSNKLRNRSEKIDGATALLIALGTQMILETEGFEQDTEPEFSVPIFF
ncbi:terminase large subunit [Rubinisphaera italica]|uniref:Phage Terminase n=1 Tax=Rubinisphaera italica TaxID=2527969 RepID=A0A5C5XNF2_9PLAN|nr:terminase TerL endonuclease subunit [Rubinisphaera italica]TWT64248.1 Phage Terminase [Rubinisphaera italica]